MGISPQKIQAFRKKILSFYRENRRDLPWRKTADPYKILVSEVMLQQTQADRVILFYTKWIAKWPTIQKLAEADRFEVLKQWSGLGYNKRALHLYETAKKISERYSGNVAEALKKERLPGIGPYTKKAVEIFAANADVAAVDTNIRRIFIHEFSLKGSEKELADLAEICVPKGKSRDWHNALMDYGSAVLTSKKTGIPAKASQPPFEGSDRQVRSQIVKYLLGKGKKEAAFFSEFQKETQIEKTRLKKILSKLVEEGVIFSRKGTYSLE